MSTLSRPEGCPSSDDLSAAVDGFIPEEIAVHVESCTACQNHLATLRRLDVAVRRRLVPPVGLAERIRQRVSEAAGADHLARKRWWLVPTLRLAAALAVTAAAVAILVQVLQRSSGPSPTLAERGAVQPPLPPVTETVAVGPREGDTVPQRPRDGAPQALPRRVRHVWAVNNVDGEKSCLQSLLPKGAYEVAVADGNTVYTVRLKDRDLQALVDQLAERKWQLASSELPQPRRPGSVTLTGRDVRYSLVLVDTGKSSP